MVNRMMEKISFWYGVTLIAGSALPLLFLSTLLAVAIFAAKTIKFKPLSKMNLRNFKK
jgi:hypothetical protein